MPGIGLAAGETLLREGAANLQRGVETVGGRLFLTDRRLLFRSHGFNVQDGDTEIPLARIRGARPCWTRLLGVLPLAPNSLMSATTVSCCSAAGNGWRPSKRRCRPSDADAPHRPRRPQRSLP